MPSRPPVHTPLHGSAKQARQAYDKQRGSPDSRGYDSAWKRVRLAFMAAYPLCADCSRDGRVTAASEVHHIRKVRDHPESRLDPRWLLALCTPCHSRRTANGE